MRHLPTLLTRGQASLVMVLLIGLVAISAALAASSLTTSNVQIEETIHQSDRAWYAAWAGVDELMYRLRARQNFGASYQISLALDDGATVSAVITGDSNQKTVVSEGYSDGVVKKIEVKVVSSSSKASFIFAVQTGVGGFELEGNTLVKGANNTSGNVYSNGDVLGIRASSGQSGSKILGNVWAVGRIGGLASPTDGGVYIEKNAMANILSACLVGGNVLAPQPPSNCPFSGTYQVAPAPLPVPLAVVDIPYWKNQAENGTDWTGDCIIGGGADCTQGTNRLGNIKIAGNLIVPSNINVTFTGPVWVVGDISVNQNNIFYTDESVGSTSVVIIASDPANPSVKGKIVTSSNATFLRNSQGAGLIFVSENPADNCAAPSIDITSNTATVVFISENGCINIGSNSAISGILAKKVHVKNNSSVIYDPSLARAIVDPNSGGWAVVSLREI